MYKTLSSPFFTPALKLTPSTQSNRSETVRKLDPSIFHQLQRSSTENTISVARPRIRGISNNSNPRTGVTVGHFELGQKPSSPKTTIEALPRNDQSKPIRETDRKTSHEPAHIKISEKLDRKQNTRKVRLSGKQNYLLWKAHMFCLMDSHNMCGIVDATFVGPRYSGTEIRRQYESLLKGWILGSLGEDVLVDVFSLSSAKAIWENLKSIYEPTSNLQQEETDKISIEIAGENITSTEDENRDKESTEDEKKLEDKKGNKKKLRSAAINGDWSEAESILKNDKSLAKEAICDDGSTALDVAVGVGHCDFMENLFSYMTEEDVLVQRNDGSTALHIAAIVGNKYAAELLVKKNKQLLEIKDNKDKEPVRNAYENMHLETIGYLLKADNEDAKSTLRSSEDSLGVNLLVNAVSAKQYKLALELIGIVPDYASKNDEVLMAIAKTFPTGLGVGERLIYPSLDSFTEKLLTTALVFLGLLFLVLIALLDILTDEEKSPRRKTTQVIFALLLVPVPSVLASVFVFIYLLLLALCYPFLVLYCILWKVATIVVPPIKRIEKKKKEVDEAQEVLKLVCDKIDNLGYSGAYHPYYKRPILEAACKNSYEVVDEILFRSPDAIESKNEDGYDIIQLAIIHRSENIYNLIYDIGESKNHYRPIVDSSKNNISHLAGRLAHSHKLNRRTGAALQLQRELQWFEEVKKHVFPTCLTQENNEKETPEMLFTREHADLVKEGEKWIKTTAESCSITAALIITIVFAAAITVPGGTNEETGKPFFKKRFSFIIFAISDAISLFASSTALLVFLSILTARFAEKDFLVSLPRQVLIGLSSLLLSTTAMMVAFSATLYLVFCESKSWVLAPICGLAFIPIAFFVTLQFPLIVDLFSSTHVDIFGKQRKSVVRRFNPDDIRLRFFK